MANPQNKLFEYLAQSHERMADIQRIHKSAAASLPNRIGNVQSELDQLRQQIETQGLGIDRASEDRYVELLKDFRQLNQSNEIAARRSQRDLRENNPRLLKALEYGQTLQRIYQPGVLVKGAGADLRSYARYLDGFGSESADTLAAELRAIADG